MKKIEFTKMVGSGNDFVVVSQLASLPVSRLKKIAKNICQRKYGIGADGLLVLEKSRVADVRMRIFNADGSEAEMCGNGARCTALWQMANGKWQKNLRIETKAGIIEARVSGESVKIKLTDPVGYKEELPIEINGRIVKVNFINTGVPHIVIFVEGIDKIDVAGIGRVLRYHKAFAPAGTNVDFVEIIDNAHIRARTYERGVEDETLACGTGVAACAIVAALRSQAVSSRYSINVKTQSTETLKVFFDRCGNKVNNVWLEGKVKAVYKGEYHV